MRYVALALAVAILGVGGIGLVSVGTAQAHGGSGYPLPEGADSKLGCGDLVTANPDAAACVFQTGGDQK